MNNNNNNDQQQENIIVKNKTEDMETKKAQDLEFLLSGPDRENYMEQFKLLRLWKANKIEEEKKIANMKKITSGMKNINDDSGAIKNEAEQKIVKINGDNITSARPNNDGITKKTFEFNRVIDLGEKLTNLGANMDNVEIDLNKSKVIPENVNKVLKKVNDNYNYCGSGKYLLSKSVHVGVNKNSMINKKNGRVFDNEINFDLTEVDEPYVVPVSKGKGFAIPYMSRSFEDISAHPNKDLLSALNIDTIKDKDLKSKIAGEVRRKIQGYNGATDYSHRLVRMAMLVLHLATCEEAGLDKLRATGLTYRHKTYSLHDFDDFVQSGNQASEQIVACVEDHVLEYNDFMALALIHWDHLAKNTIYSCCEIAYADNRKYNILGTVKQGFESKTMSIENSIRVEADALSAEACFGYMQSYARIMGIGKHVGTAMLIASTLAQYKPGMINDLPINSCRGELDFLHNMLRKDYEHEEKMGIDARFRNIRVIGYEMALGSLYYLGTVMRLPKLIKQNEDTEARNKYIESLSNEVTGVSEAMRAEACITGYQINILQYFLGHMANIEDLMTTGVSVRDYITLMKYAPYKSIFASLFDGIDFNNISNLNTHNREFKTRVYALYYCLMEGADYDYENYEEVRLNVNVDNNFGAITTLDGTIFIHKKKQNTRSKLFSEEIAESLITGGLEVKTYKEMRKRGVIPKSSIIIVDPGNRSSEDEPREQREEKKEKEEKDKEKKTDTGNNDKQKEQPKSNKSEKKIEIPKKKEAVKVLNAAKKLLDDDNEAGSSNNKDTMNNKPEVKNPQAGSNRGSSVRSGSNVTISQSDPNNMNAETYSAIVRRGRELINNAAVNAQPAKSWGVEDLL